MKGGLRFLGRIVRNGVLAAGGLALAGAAVQFTPLPWRAYRWLGECPNPSPHSPTHILVMGGSGIPGKSGLMRTFYGAEAARRHPRADLLVAMPLTAGESDASQAYLEEMEQRGVPPERMRILPDGSNTREQAMRLAEHLGAGAAESSVLIVSDPEHIRRCAAALRKTGISQVAALPAHSLSIDDPLPGRPPAPPPPVPPPAPAPPGTPPDHSRSGAGSSPVLRYQFWNHLHYSLDVLREWTALAYYRFRGWI
jgi:uncharacterized SAM-binding protein YcdF (DUF218 family)